MEKQILRDMFFKRRKLLDEKMYNLFNFMLLDKLKTVLKDLNVKNIAVFYPMHHEVDLRSLDENYKLFYPNIVKKRIEFFEDIKSFKKAPFNTTVPDHNQITDLDNIDVVIVPGLVFDHNFYRIGYGKGYYDELLSRYKGLTIGVCFELFLIQELPTEAHDQAVNIIVTDQRVLKR